MNLVVEKGLNQGDTTNTGISDMPEVIGLPHQQWLPI